MKISDAKLIGAKDYINLCQPVAKGYSLLFELLIYFVMKLMIKTTLFDVVFFICK